jgi:hypothetical protein
LEQFRSIRQKGLVNCLLGLAVSLDQSIHSTKLFKKLMRFER